MISAPGYFHLHLISDSTGETLITVARAAAAQYSRIMPVEHVHPLVRTQKQLDRVLNEIEEMPGIVLYTLLQENLAGIKVVKAFAREPSEQKKFVKSADELMGQQLKVMRIMTFLFPLIFFIMPAE